MKLIHLASIILLGLWLVITGYYGLSGGVITQHVATFMNVLALLSGLFFVVSGIKWLFCCSSCCGDKCKCNCHENHCDKCDDHHHK